uniref:Uncharacterized protein n=1 Tax=Cucumis melo TaxID=3656 RepID=A0A9I9EED3_CUCME
MKRKGMYQETTKCSLNPNCSPFLADNPEIPRWSTEDSGNSSSKRISGSRRIRAFRSCFMSSFITLPSRAQVP